MKEGNEVKITLEDFKLIKSFYPEFTRKQVSSNDFIIGWSELMPVVEKIATNYDVSIRYFSGDCACHINKQSIEGLEICSFGNFEPSITNVYKAVIEFIEWYNKTRFFHTL